VDEMRSKRKNHRHMAHVMGDIVVFMVAVVAFIVGLASAA
jgi:hypothetical protein